jgi:hypothetical protein
MNRPRLECRHFAIARELLHAHAQRDTASVAKKKAILRRTLLLAFPQ